MNQLTKAAKTLAAKCNSTSLILRIAIGLVVGSVLALICPGAAWIEEFGNLFVGALKGVAPVLVFVIVASALAQGSSKLDRRFGTVVWLYMLTTFVRRIARRCARQAVPADAGSGGSCHGGCGAPGPG